MSGAKLIFSMGDGKFLHFELSSWTTESIFSLLEEGTIRSITLERTRTNPTTETTELKLGPQINWSSYFSSPGTNRRTGPASRRVRFDPNRNLLRRQSSYGRRSTDLWDYSGLPVERRTGPASRRMKFNPLDLRARRKHECGRRSTDTVKFWKLLQERRNGCDRRNRCRLSSYLRRDERRLLQRRTVSGRRT